MEDALLLLAMIHVIFKENLDNLKHLQDHVNGLDEVKSIAQAYSPEVVATSVGIAAEDIRQLALDFAKAEKACCYSRMGACTQSFGGLNLWLTYVLNIISGNFDQEGGYMFTQPAFDIVKLNSRKNRPDSYKKYTSRVWEFPYYNGEFPVATLADEILTSGEGQIKAMVTVAGNPIVTTPNADQLDKAFESLEFYVAVDIYINATTRHADIILPGCTAFEIAQYDVSFHNLAVRNTVKYSPPLFEKEDYQKDDWEILQELTARLSDKPIQRMTPEMMLEYGFMSGPHKDKGINLQKLLENPHGIDLGPLQTCLLDRIETSDEKISLAPEVMLDDLPRLEKAMQEDQQTSFSHRLIGRRLLRSHNSWTQNSYRLVKGRNECTLLLHPEDAQAKGIENGDRVEVISAVGKVQIEVEVSDEIMPGVVSIPQGWGQAGKGIRLSVAEGKSGVNMNKLTDHKRIDQLTGNAAVNGVPVNISVINVA
jgi:anaerobic selenocysteine-containing dehydrogenase